VKAGRRPRTTKEVQALVSAAPRTHYLVLWWHLQRMYVGLFENETEATLHAAARNGVVVELIGPDVHVGATEDYWRRDAQGKPMPGEWRTSRALVAV